MSLFLVVENNWKKWPCSGHGFVESRCDCWMCSRLGILTIMIYKTVSLCAQFVCYKKARYHTHKKRHEKLRSRKANAAAVYVETYAAAETRFDRKAEKRKKCLTNERSIAEVYFLNLHGRKIRLQNLFTVTSAS